MTLDEYNTFCAGLKHTTHVVQWGGAHVWKVAGKVFAIAGWSDGKELAVTFKVTDLAFEILPQQPGIRPAPYLASRGMKWVQHHEKPGLDDDSLKAYITESHKLVSLGLSRKRQKELGIGQYG
jgi:predicted DNA-binding protein (MmcQ/YjbR family)